MADEYEIAEAETPKPKRVKVPDEILDMDLPFDPERYDMSDCILETRAGDETTPFEDQSVWLTPYTPTSVTEAGTGFAASSADMMAVSFERLRRGLSQVVVYHDLTDPNTGEPLPQWWRDPDAVEEAPSPVLFYAWSLAVSGEPPTARPKGSKRGRRGTSTRSSTARRSRS